MAEKSGRLAGAVRAAGVTVVPAHAAGALADSQPARVSTTRAATAPPRAMYLTSISRAPLSTGGFRSGARHASTLPASRPMREWNLHRLCQRGLAESSEGLRSGDPDGFSGFRRLEDGFEHRSPVLFITTGNSQ